MRAMHCGCTIVTCHELIAFVYSLVPPPVGQLQQLLLLLLLLLLTLFIRVPGRILKHPSIIVPVTKRTVNGSRLELTFLVLPLTFSGRSGPPFFHNFGSFGPGLGQHGCGRIGGKKRIVVGAKWPSHSHVSILALECTLLLSADTVQALGTWCSSTCSQHFAASQALQQNIGC